MRDLQTSPGGLASGQLPERAGGGAEWPALQACWDKLTRNLSALDQTGGIALAFSGGMDSMVLLQICRRIGLDVLAVHCTGPQFSARHSQQAVNWLEERGMPYLVVEHSALDVPELRRSDPRRCYHCKSLLIKRLREAMSDAAGESGGGRSLCDGTNASDLHGHRPGLQALAEAGVHSPFLDAALSKPMLRLLAEILGLELPASGGQNCLLTRFEYGLPVSEAQLRAVENVESALLRLLGRDVQYRLRYLADRSKTHGARAELHIQAERPLSPEVLEKAAAVLARHGLAGAPILAMPKVSGYFDVKMPGNETS